jgi:RNA polymerase sigma-70 factor (ECF subfamily)
MGESPSVPVEELVAAARNGDREAFAALIERYRHPVFALAYSYMRNAEEAEDVAQEAFARALSALPSLERPERFPSWLNGIAAHAAVDRLRQRATAGAAAEPWKDLRAPPAPTPEEAVARAERRGRISKALEAALGELPEESRRAVLLRFFAEMSYAQIAEFTAVPVSTVRGQLYRATRHLRDRLRRVWEGHRGEV